MMAAPTRYICYEEDEITATRGFTGRGGAAGMGTRLPPGQFVTDDFPVLSAGPTPRIALENWRFTLKMGPRPIKQWSWREFISLPTTAITRDIHCVWSKFDTAWEGVPVDDVLVDAGIEPPTPYVLAHSVDGYTTNVPARDLVGGRAMVALACYAISRCPPIGSGPSATAAERQAAPSARARSAG